jgi:hypothetical protein
MTQNPVHMTDDQLIHSAVALATEAETLEPEDILLWPDALAPQRRRLRSLKLRFMDLCDEISERGLGEQMRAAEAVAFEGK